MKLSIVTCYVQAVTSMLEVEKKKAIHEFMDCSLCAFDVHNKIHVLRYLNVVYIILVFLVVRLP